MNRLDFNMNSMELDKQELRKKYTLIREKITNKKEKSAIIIDKIINNKTFINSKIIAIYKNLKNEVNTDELIEYSLKNNKIVVLPRVEDNELKFYRIFSLNDKFEKSKFGVEEPIKDKRYLVDKNSIDLVIVPGLCFDMKNNRLGYGKGYYDRFLKDSK